MKRAVFFLKKMINKLGNMPASWRKCAARTPEDRLAAVKFLKNQETVSQNLRTPKFKKLRKKNSKMCVCECSFSL